MFYILQCLKRLFFFFHNFAVQQVVEREFNREVKVFVFVFVFFFQKAGVLKGFRIYLTAGSFFSLKVFNAMLSVCLLVSGFL